MSETPKRRPAAFAMPAEPQADDKPKPAAKRKPAAVSANQVKVVAPEDDIFNAPALLDEAPPPIVEPRRRGLTAGKLFFGALGLLVSAAVALWTDALVRDLFARNDWLGWAAVGVVAVGVLALLFIVAREAWALRRLAHTGALRDKAKKAHDSNDARAAQTAVSDLVSHVSANPATARGRAALKETHGEIIDGADLIGLAETEVLAPLDAEARRMILDAAKRVSVVTAVSPRALVDVGYVLFESARLVRRLAELYGARPGTLGFIRLARDVVAHLAVTGGIAMGDSIIQQLVGHGVAARLSARLGEGVVNAMMTARVGIAAMDVVRPFPFMAAPRPRLTDIVRELVSFQRAKTEAKDGGSTAD